MSALNLPKPVNTYAGEDELRNVNAGPNGTANGNDVSGSGDNGAVGGQEEVVEEYRPPRRSDKFLAGIIYPPKEIRAIVDKTALHIFKSPTPELLEEKIREHQKNDPKFAFLSADDPYYQYYKYMLEKSREDAEDAAKGIVKQKEADAEKKKKEQEITTTATEPRAHEFKVDLPGVTAHDLDILRLTALFHARRGRAFLSSLSVREGRNYQFDFLRPTHSLYGYYNRMVESYQKIMQPPPGQIDNLVKAASDPMGRWGILEEGKNRAEWEKYRRRKEDIKQKEKDDEAEADAVIDWQDFVLVETIEFTQSDMELNLPPPSSIEELRNRSMGEKRMASMIMEETGAGAAPTSAGKGSAPGSAGMPGAPTGPRSQRQPQAQQQAKVEDEEMEMDEEEEEEAEELRLQRIKEEKEQARARDIQRAAMESRGMKIKKDYVPKGINRNVVVNTAKCPNCGQSIPENELAEHIRIELLDPRWKEQKRQLEARKQQHYSVNPGADISSSLRNLAAARTDLFGDEMDEATRKAKEEDEKRKKREREKIVWDGHTASAAKTSENFQSSFNMEEQIKHMHQRMGLVETGDGDGPKIGPAVPTGPRAAQPSAADVPPALAAGAATPGGGTAYEGATISAPPSGPTTKEYYEAAPLRPAAGLPSRPAAGGAAGGIHPSRLAMMSTGGDATPPPPPAAPASSKPAAPAPVTGQSRHAPDDAEMAAAPKRAKVEKLAFGQYTEVDWLSLHPHPITLSVQLPVMPDKPEWKLDGSIIPLDGIMVNSTFGDMRERIKRALNVELPISRLQITYEGKVMPNAGTLAGVNLGEGDLVGLGVKKR